MATMIDAAATPSCSAGIYDARVLLLGQPTVQIVLDGHVYVLRITKSGKLILTK